MNMLKQMIVSAGRKQHSKSIRLNFKKRAFLYYPSVRSAFDQMIKCYYPLLEQNIKLRNNRFARMLHSFILKMFNAVNSY